MAISASRLGSTGPLTELVEQVSRLVQGITGVQLGERQRSMVEARISRRMVDLRITSPGGYADYLAANQAAETEILVSLLTTHHTFFFREFEQFEFLRDKGLQRIADGLLAKGQKHLRVWSMACSRGQEVYSLAMFLHAHWAKLVPGGTFEILGTDVDPESVDIARNGVYRIDEIKTVPSTYLAGHWSRGTGEIANFVRAKDSLRQVVRFEATNLMKLEAPSPNQSYDLILCRNVFIYFTPEQISSITSRIIRFMAPHAYFIIGTTESLSGLKLPLAYLGASIYQHPETPAKPTSAAPELAKKLSVVPVSVSGVSSASGVSSGLAPGERGPIRVFCVDDSPTVHALLKNILSRQNGFEIVDTAMNGEEALQKAPSLKFDVMTLDIHMPLKNGVDYLKERPRAGHPPIVMLSSISREEVTLGVRTLELGAVDYVEKPSLANITERGDELRTKLRCAVAAAGDGSINDAATTAHTMAKALARTSKVPRQNETLRIIYAGIGEKAKLAQLLGSLAKPQPPTIILTEGPEALINAFASNLQSACALPVRPTPHDWANGASEQISDTVWVASTANPPASLTKLLAGRRSVILVYNSVSSKTLQDAKALGAAPLILEESVGSTHAPAAAADRARLATQVLPYTSFLFDSDYLLNKD